MMCSVEKFEKLFSRTWKTCKASIIGMVHVLALPGTPKHQHPMDAIAEKACREAMLYQELGLDGVLVENLHDLPYLRGSVGPEITAGMARVCSEVRRAVPKLPLGVQILSGANKEALAVAHGSGANFIRAKGYVVSRDPQDDWKNECAGELLRYRKSIGAEDILVFNDVKTPFSIGTAMDAAYAIGTREEGLRKYLELQKCAYTLTTDSNPQLTEFLAAQYFLTDGVILTGDRPGDHTHEPGRTFYKTRESNPLPLIIGSGVTVFNVEKYYSSADALIIGSDFKVEEDFDLMNDVDKNRVTEFMVKYKKLE